MTTVSETDLAAIGRNYVLALADQNWDAAASLWAPDGVDDLVGVAELHGPEEVIEYFKAFAAAVPDLVADIMSVTAQDDRAVVHWRMRGTFNGTGTLLGLAPNGRTFDMLGTDVLTIRDGKIVHNAAITNGLEFARQLAIMPPSGSLTERVLFGLVNSVAPIARTVRARKTT